MPGKKLSVLIIFACSLPQFSLSYAAPQQPELPLSGWVSTEASNYATFAQATPGVSPQLKLKGCNYASSTDAWPYSNAMALGPGNALAAGLPAGGCGACFEVLCAPVNGTSKNPCYPATGGGTSDPPSVVVTVVDSCPGCSGGTISLHPLAISKLAPLSQGPIPVRYRQVACRPPGNVVVTVEQYSLLRGGWLRLHVSQVAGSGGVKSVWLRSSNSSASFNPGTAANGADQSQAAAATPGWVLMSNTDGASWELSAPPPAPLDALIYNQAGQMVLARSIIPSAGATGNFQTSAQFPRLPLQNRVAARPLNSSNANGTAGRAGGSMPESLPMSHLTKQELLNVALTDPKLQDTAVAVAADTPQQPPSFGASVFDSPEAAASPEAAGNSLGNSTAASPPAAPASAPAAEQVAAAAVRHAGAATPGGNSSDQHSDGASKVDLDTAAAAVHMSLGNLTSSPGASIQGSPSPVAVSPPPPTSSPTPPPSTTSPAAPSQPPTKSQSPLSPAVQPPSSPDPAAPAAEAVAAAATRLGPGTISPSGLHKAPFHSVNLTSVAGAVKLGISSQLVITSAPPASPAPAPALEQAAAVASPLPPPKLLPAGPLQPIFGAVDQRALAAPSPLPASRPDPLPFPAPTSAMAALHQSHSPAMPGSSGGSSSGSSGGSTPTPTASQPVTSTAPAFTAPPASPIAALVVPPPLTALFVVPPAAAATPEVDPASPSPLPPASTSPPVVAAPGTSSNSTHSQRSDVQPEPGSSGSGTSDNTATVRNNSTGNVTSTNDSAAAANTAQPLLNVAVVPAAASASQLSADGASGGDGKAPMPVIIGAAVGGVVALSAGVAGWVMMRRRRQAGSRRPGRSYFVDSSWMSPDSRARKEQAAQRTTTGAAAARAGPMHVWAPSSGTQLPTPFQRPSHDGSLASSKTRAEVWLARRQLRQQESTSLRTSSTWEDSFDVAPSDASSCSDDFDAYSTHDNLLFRMDQASLRSSKPSLPPCPDSMMDRMLGTDFDITAGTPPTPFSRAAQLGLPTAGSLPQAPPSVASKPELELASLPQSATTSRCSSGSLAGTSVGCGDSMSPAHLTSTAEYDQLSASAKEALHQRALVATLGEDDLSFTSAGSGHLLATGAGSFTSASSMLLGTGAQSFTSASSGPLLASGGSELALPPSTSVPFPLPLAGVGASRPHSLLSTDLMRASQMVAAAALGAPVHTSPTIATPSPARHPAAGRTPLLTREGSHGLPPRPPSASSLPGSRRPGLASSESSSSGDSFTGRLQWPNAAGFSRNDMKTTVNSLETLSPETTDAYTAIMLRQPEGDAQQDCKPGDQLPSPATGMHGADCTSSPGGTPNALPSAAVWRVCASRPQSAQAGSSTETGKPAGQQAASGWSSGSASSGANAGAGAGWQEARSLGARPQARYPSWPVNGG